MLSSEYAQWAETLSSAELLGQIEVLQYSTLYRLETIAKNFGVLHASRMVNNPEFNTPEERELLALAKARGLRGTTDLFEFEQ
jgi:hypothetical protein